MGMLPGSQTGTLVVAGRGMLALHSLINQSLK
jgi:hypothetical protein